MSILTEAVKNLTEVIVKEAPAAVLASLTSGKTLVQALAGVLTGGAKQSIEEAMAAAGITVTPAAYAARVAGDPGVKKALRAAGAPETSEAGKAILLAVTAAVMQAETKDLKKLAGVVK